MKFIFSLLLLSSSAMATYSEWTDEKKNWFIASNVAILADWTTTRNLTRRYDEGFYETNKILGKYPSTDKVNGYFVGVLGLNYLLAEYLPKPYDEHVLIINTVTFGSAAINNNQLGLKFKF